MRRWRCRARGASSATPLRMCATLAADTAVALISLSRLLPASHPVALRATVLRLVFVVLMAASASACYATPGFATRTSAAGSFNRKYGICLIPFGLHGILTGSLPTDRAFCPGPSACC